MVVRELTGGVTYEIERIGRVAFEFAGQRRNEVTSSDERNVMKSGVLWDEVITALRAREYPDVEPLAISNNTEDRNPIRQNRSRFKGMINLAATAIALK
jgi:Isocitrate/isopropylmalate dehydrogenase